MVDRIEVYLMNSVDKKNKIKEQLNNEKIQEESEIIKADIERKKTLMH